MKVHPSRANAIRRRLLDWWDAGHRDLPWRFPQDGADPYRVWIAEVMLQQTRVAVAVPYYRRFVRRFPTLRSLARASEEAVLAQWSGLGYYARARRLAPAAREALARFGGLPASAEALATLPGFGPYTAGAVASIAFGVRAPCVDGNVARVLGRVFRAGGGSARDRRARLWRLADALVPERRPGDFNQALMELGATVCSPRSPGCGRCPVDGACDARRSGHAIAPPPSRRARPVPTLRVACGVVRKGDAVLLVRQSGEGLFGGLWSLPFAVVAPGHGARAVAARAVRVTTGLAVAPRTEVVSVERVLTHRRLRLTAVDCRRLDRVAAPPVTRWYSLRERTSSRSGGQPPLPTAMRKLLEALAHFRETP